MTGELAERVAARSRRFSDLPTRASGAPPSVAHSGCPGTAPILGNAERRGGGQPRNERSTRRFVGAVRTDVRQRLRCEGAYSANRLLVRLPSVRRPGASAGDFASEPISRPPLPWWANSGQTPPSHLGPHRTFRRSIDAYAAFRLPSVPECESFMHGYGLAQSGGPGPPDTDAASDPAKRRGAMRSPGHSLGAAWHRCSAGHRRLGGMRCGMAPSARRLQGGTCPRIPAGFHASATASRGTAGPHQVRKTPFLGTQR